MHRAPFYDNLSAMLMLADDPLLIDTLPAGDPHNVAARILRLGVAVTAFSALESYIYECFQRAAGRLTIAKLKYTDFPDALKEFLIVKAVAGLANRGERLESTIR